MSIKDYWRYFRTSVRNKVISWTVGLAGLGFLFVALPILAGSTINRFLEQEVGLNAVIGRWSVSLIDANVIAYDVKLESGNNNVLQLDIESVTFDYKWLRILAGEGLRSALREIRLDKPHLTIIQESTHELELNSLINTSVIAKNWSLLSNLTRDAGEKEKDQPIHLDTISADDMRIDFRANKNDVKESETGETTYSDVNFYDVNLVVTNVIWPLSEYTSDQNVNFFGRVWEGVFDLKIDGSIFNWQPEIKNGKSDLRWNPNLSGRLTLDKVSVETIWNILPEPNLIARNGRVFGNVNFSCDQRLELKIDSGLRFVDVMFSRKQGEKDDGSTKWYEISNTGEADLELNLDKENVRPFTSLLSAVVEDVLKKADTSMELLEAAVASSNANSAGMTEASYNAMNNKRPGPLQTAIGVAAGLVVATRLEKKMGSTNATALGLSTTENVLNADTSGQTNQPGKTQPEKKKKGTLLGNWWRKNFGKEKE
ncbi:MAG: hypothetical protein AAF431_11795 [Pseudomonadota bacterium]